MKLRALDWQKLDGEHEDVEKVWTATVAGETVIIRWEKWEDNVCFGLPTIKAGEAFFALFETEHGPIYCDKTKMKVKTLEEAKAICEEHIKVIAEMHWKKYNDIMEPE